MANSVTVIQLQRISIRAVARLKIWVGGWWGGGHLPSLSDASYGPVY